MRRVRCYECGKVYDYDVDDFCPKCGAYTQPGKSSTIDASGAVVRVDGLNERGHRESFVHEEFHEENRERKRMGLSKGVRRTAAKPRAFAANTARGTASSRQATVKSPVGLIVKIIAAIILLQTITGVVGLVSQLLFGYIP